MADKWELDLKNFYFQELHVSEEEEAVIEIMLNETGWVEAKAFGNDKAVDSLVEDGLLWWTIINGRKWVVAKPMAKKEFKRMKKKIKREMKSRGLNKKTNEIDERVKEYERK